MTPAQAISMLDRQVARHGQRVVFRRGTTAGSPTVITAGVVRGYKPEALVGLITQADRNITLSPSGQGTYGAPRVADLVSLDGVQGSVKSVEEIKIGATVVRYNLRVTLT